MTTYRLIIEYDGAAFCGWQIQPEQETVQGRLEKALETMLGGPVRVQGAGRTDSGVHALGQVASFETDTELDVSRLRRGLSALCRPNVSVVDAVAVPDGFNARFDSCGKHYRYRVLARRSPSPLWRKTSWHVPQNLDLNLMKNAAADFVGQHDFAGFRASDDGRESTVRELTAVSVSSGDPAMLCIDVSGTAFLKNMVRIIAGTLVDVGRGRLHPEVVKQVLSSLDRSRAGQTAPAHGLTLVEVFYEPEWIRKDRKKNPLS